MDEPHLCMTCRFAKWVRNAAGHFRESGWCQWEYDPPEISSAYRWETLDGLPSEPVGGFIYRNVPITGCPVYEPEEKTDPVEEIMALPAFQPEPKP